MLKEISSFVKLHSRGRIYYMFDFFRVTPKKRRVKIKKGGVIYSNPGGAKRLIFRVGTGLLLLSLIYFSYLYYPLAKALWSYQLQAELEIEPVEEEVVVEKRKEEEVINLEDFRVSIPKILAEAEVKAEVSPFDKTDYLPVLADDVVAHAKGSDLPGQGKGKTVYLFAHSTHQGLRMVRKNAVFYLLGKLVAGDVVEVGFSGKTYKYRVYESKVVESKEVEYLDYRNQEKEILVLQTCWPLGTDWKRLLVLAELMEAR